MPTTHIQQYTGQYTWYRTCCKLLHGTRWEVLIYVHYAARPAARQSSDSRKSRSVSLQAAAYCVYLFTLSHHGISSACGHVRQILADAVHSDEPVVPYDQMDEGAKELLEEVGRG